MIELRVLGGAGLDGPPECSAHQVLVQPKRFALFVYLTLASRTTLVRRDALLAMFWPEQGESSARGALSQSLTFLRRALGADAIVSRGDAELGVDQRLVHCDAVEFDAAIDRDDCESALALYRGDLLEAFHISGSETFGRWLDDERRRLNARAVACATRLADAAVAAGDHARALEYAREAGRCAPHDEPIARRLILALEALGERAQAVRAYDAFAARLKEDLELEPSPQLAALIERVRRPSPAEPTDAVPPVLSPPAAAVAPPAMSEVHDFPTPERYEFANLKPVRRRRARTVTRTAVLTLMMIVGWLALSARGDPPREPPPPKLPSVAVTSGQEDAASPSAEQATWPTVFVAPHDEESHRVAVLPFENLTGAPELAYVADLASEEILAGVLQTGHTVVDRAAVRVLLPPSGLLPADLVDRLAETRGATIIVTGNYAVEHDTLRIRATVSDANTKRVLYTLEPERGPRADPLVAIGHLRDRVLGGILTTAEARTMPVALRPPLVDAYREYAKVANTRSCDEARPGLERAIALDSTFVEPYDRRLECIRSSSMLPEKMVEYGRVLEPLLRRRGVLSAYDQLRVESFQAVRAGDMDESLRLARRLYQLTHSPRWAYLAGWQAAHIMRPWLAIKYLTLSDSSYFERGLAGQFVILAYAYHFTGDHRAELATVERGRRSSPALNWDEEYMRAYVGLRDPRRLLAIADSSLPRIQKLEQLRGWQNVFNRTMAELRRHGDLVTARALADRYIARLRTFEGQEPAAFRESVMAFAFNARGDADSCRVHVQRSMAAAKGPAPLNTVARMAQWAVRWGDSTRARLVADSIATITSDDAGMGQREYWRAILLAELGRRDEAVALLREARRLGSMQVGWHYADALRSLHGYPPFEALVAVRR